MKTTSQPGYEALSPSEAAGRSSTEAEAEAEADEEESKGFLTGVLSQAPQHGYRPAGNRIIWIVTAVNVLVFLTTLSLFASWYYQQRWQLNAARRHDSTYSPILDRLDLESRSQKINGTLFPPRDGASIARQMPNPAADAAWAEWELMRVLPVTHEQVVRMGKDPSTVARLEDAVWGLGDDAYAAALDVYHQLHCVNMLRTIAYGGYYNRTMVEAGGEPTIREVHLNHCVDILVQAIQCSGNVNLITLHWTDTQKLPYPDMSINRQCINFEKLTQWRKENTVDMDRYAEVMKKPAGVKSHPQADAYYEYFHKGEPNPNHVDGANPDDDFNF